MDSFTTIVLDKMNRGHLVPELPFDKIMVPNSLCKKGRDFLLKAFQCKIVSSGNMHQKYAFTCSIG